MQIEALHGEKRNITRVLQQRDSQLEDAHNRLKQALVGDSHCHLTCDFVHRLISMALKVSPLSSAQDKTVALSSTNATLDADAHEAKSAQHRLQQDKARMEQQMEVLQSHNKWLEEELTSKNEAAQQERRAVTAQVQHSLDHRKFHLYLLNVQTTICSDTNLRSQACFKRDHAIEAH